MIKLVLSTDASGFQHPATVLASILRRTEASVHARIYIRGFDQQSFDAGRLRVDFVRCDKPVTGTYPRHVNEAVFDRLRVIHDFDDWDRALVLDHDMLVFCDLAEYFQIPFDDSLLLGRHFGAGVTVGLQLAKRGGLPVGWEDAGRIPYFYMGPMMNLKAMRKEDFWRRFQEVHEIFGKDEQISLTVACSGRTKAVDRKWNLVPQWDKLSELSNGIACNGSEFVGELSWHCGVPEGLIHWTGPMKPWHYNSKVWRADLWNAERCGWEQLRTQAWEKPIAFEIEPDGISRAKALWLRGWRIDIPTHDGLPSSDIRYPDAPKSPDFNQSSGALSDGRDQEADLVRFGPAAGILAWLERLQKLPDRLVVEGPRPRQDIESLRNLGYLGESRIIRNQWPGGGPHPKVLTYLDPGEAIACAYDEDLYLSKLPGEQSRNQRAPESDSVAHQMTERLSDSPSSLITQLSRLMPKACNAMVLGVGESLKSLKDYYSGCSFLVIDSSPRRLAMGRVELGEHSELQLRHAPLDATLPWYDLTDIDLPHVDLLVVTESFGKPGFQSSATSLQSYLKGGGMVVIEGSDSSILTKDLEMWKASGFEQIAEDGLRRILQRSNNTGFSFGEQPTIPHHTFDMGKVAEKIYVISLPERTDRICSLRQNWSNLGLNFEVIDGVRVSPHEIRWDEMKGMEAYGKLENLRTEYVIGATGCKRAGIQALEAFIQSGTETCLICQDDCRWIPRAPKIVEKAVRELPSDWDLVYFSASARQKHLPYSPHLVKLQGARFCTAILWKRETALRLLPGLAECDCELDVFMQRSHAILNAFCVVPMPAYQSRSQSDIVRQVVKPPNV